MHKWRITLFVTVITIMVYATSPADKVSAEVVEGAQSADALKNHVIELSHNIGERNYWFYKNLEKAAEYIKGQFESFGYEVELQTYEFDDKKFSNVIAIKKGDVAPDEIIIVGAHYDSVMGGPGADDNASAVAGLLELARMFSSEKTEKTIKFVAFVNEEPPYFLTEKMGSRVFAKAARFKGENIVAMVCLEMIGYYDSKPNSQDYPPLYNFFYPDTANFIALVSSFSSMPLLKRVEKSFKKHSDFPIESIVAPSIVVGVDWSDHSSFWKYGYKAIMVTDTSFYRYPHYHSQADTYEKLDYESMVEVVKGLFHAIAEL
ncbi:M20/M25/M40 family metallo-hydrolase [Thermoproteota archaeon]